MATKTFCVCDTCQRVITNPEEGFIVQGNIYAATVEGRGGLIGNNFPPTSEKFTQADVGEMMFCRRCFCMVLGLGAA